MVLNPLGKLDMNIWCKSSFLSTDMTQSRGPHWSGVINTDSKNSPQTTPWLKLCLYVLFMTEWDSHASPEECPCSRSKAVNRLSLMWLPLAVVNTESLDLLQHISSQTWTESNMSCSWIKSTERWADTTEIQTETRFPDVWFNRFVSCGSLWHFFLFC